MVNSNKSKLIAKPHHQKSKNKSGSAPYKNSAHGEQRDFVKTKRNQQNVNKNRNKCAPDGTKGASISLYKKSARGKAAFTQSKEAQKHERAKKFQERQALRVQKQKQLEEERAKAKQEKEEKIRQYKKKRLEKTKALNKKTHRGQPLMKDRMQLLLKQIQEMKKN